MKTEIRYTKDYVLLVYLNKDIVEGTYYLTKFGNFYRETERIFTYEEDKNEPRFNNRNIYFPVVAYKKRNPQAPDLDLPLLPEIEDNVEKFSLEDMKKAIEMAREIKDNKDIFDIDSISGLTEVCTYDWEERYSTEEIIQSLSTKQLPKEFIPEYRYYYHSSKEFYSDAGFVECSKEQYESIKVEIPTCPLKTELKTITNSEGKEVIVGKWIY